jgi:hypothetical protein
MGGRLLFTFRSFGRLGTSLGRHGSCRSVVVEVEKQLEGEVIGPGPICDAVGDGVFGIVLALPISGASVGKVDVVDEDVDDNLGTAVYGKLLELTPKVSVVGLKTIVTNVHKLVNVSVGDGVVQGGQRVNGSGNRRYELGHERAEGSRVGGSSTRSLGVESSSANTRACCSMQQGWLSFWRTRQVLVAKPLLCLV